MGHIADLMVTSAIMNPSTGFYPRDSSPSSSCDNNQSNSKYEDRDQPRFMWRMHQPSQTKKYNLFPHKSHEKLSITTPILGRSFGREVSAAMAKVGNSGNKVRKTVAVGSQQEPVSGMQPPPTVGKMDRSLDSPTIPGRYPVHERSISAPGQDWRPNNAKACSTNSSVEATQSDTEYPRVVRVIYTRRSSSLENQKTTTRQRPPRPQRPLAPLIIPSNATLSVGSETFPKRTLSRLSEQSYVSDEPPEVPPKSARMLPDFSPQCAHTAPLTCSATLSPFTPYTPLSAAASATAFPKTTSEAPPEIPITLQKTLIESRSSPSLSTTLSNHSNLTPPESPGSTPSPLNHLRGNSESSMLLNISKRSHKRSGSDTSTLKRGRVRQRLEEPTPEEREEFEKLPTGFKALEVLTDLSAEELVSLKDEAIGQAGQFEILPAKEVKKLSKELRGLDERCSYLRNTHRSLRSGRRNLHERICTYLRSPRVAKFSYEALLRQEEALAELDNSIDDWVSKLELAENRRLRIRQKLLEHVAACLLLPGSNKSTTCESVVKEVVPDKTDSSIPAPEVLPPSVASTQTPPKSPSRSPSPETINETTWLELNTPGLPPGDFQTMSAPPAEPLPPPPALLAEPIPPQCPNRLSPAPNFSSTAEIIKHYQSQSARNSCVSSINAGRPSAESIRIYMPEEDVYQLMAEVEDGIVKMGGEYGAAANKRPSGEILLPNRYGDEILVRSKTAPTGVGMRRMMGGRF